MTEILESQAMVEAIIGFEHAEQWSQVIASLTDHMRRNLKGFVTWYYDTENETAGFRFGGAGWPRLTQPGTDIRWNDDPLNDRFDDIPLAEFLTYLRDWYWPRRRMMGLDTNAPGIHLAAAREVAA